MASTPHNAQHGPPRNDDTDGPTAGSGDPSGPAPGYVADPYLQVIWNDAPVIVGTAGTGSGGAGAHRNHPAFTVDLESIRDAENGILGQARGSVAGYMHLKELVRSAIDGGTVFGQQATETVSHDNNSVFYGVSNGPGPDRPDTIEADGPVQQAAQAYAAAMNPVMSEVLRQIADALESVGQFVVALDAAGQQYASADRNSFFPDPPPPVVTTT